MALVPMEPEATSIPTQGRFAAPAPGDVTVVSVRDLVKRYGDVIALDHFDLQIRKGEVFGLLGPNGSGKTTAINCILALLAFDQGRIELFGEPMGPTRYDLKRRIGVVPQEVAVVDELTVAENIDYFCALYVANKRERRALVEDAIRFVGLEGYERFRPAKLSGGLKRRLNIACGIAHRPELIFLDEPTVAVDPQSRNRILEGILELNRAGSTIVYTSHYMEEVEQICTQIMVMDHGRAIAQGTNDELKAMIGTGEKIRVEVGELEDTAAAEGLLDALRALPHVLRASLEHGTLAIGCSPGAHNLTDVLEILRAHGVPFARVYSEPPTLNDVFLELTGTELRD